MYNKEKYQALTEKLRSLLSELNILPDMEDETIKVYFIKGIKITTYDEGIFLQDTWADYAPVKAPIVYEALIAYIVDNFPAE